MEAWDVRAQGLVVKVGHKKWAQDDVHGILRGSVAHMAAVAPVAPPPRH